MNSNHPLAPRVRIVQIIIGALLLGMMIFMVVVVIVTSPPKVNPGMQVLNFFGVGLAIVSLLLSWMVPRLMVKAGLLNLAKQQPDADADTAALCQIWLSSTIVAGAVLEGPVFVNLFAYMQSPQPVNLVVAGGLIILAMTLTPTLPRVETWLTEQLQWLNDERSRQLS